MSAAIFNDGKFQGIGNDGKVVPYGKLYVTDAVSGSPVNTFRDSVISSPNTYPINLSASGKADVFLTDGKFNITLTDKNGVTVWTINDFIPSGGSGGGGLSPIQTISQREDVTGIVGSTYTLQEVPTTTINIHKNGALLNENEYSLSNDVVTFTTPLITSDKLVYEYGNHAGAVNDNAFYSVDTVADLANIPTLMGSVSVKGYYVPNDGGGGVFNYDGSSPSDNGGTVINKWVRQYSGAIYAKWFGVKEDGVTDNTVEIIKAIDEAIAKNVSLKIDETVVVSSELVNIHNVKKEGRGKILTSGNTFYIEPIENETNTLYVTPTGSSGEDGLTLSTPMGIKTAFATLKKYGEVLNGVWKIRLSAGEYNASNTGFDSSLSGFKSNGRVYVLGADVGGHPNVPTTIFNGTGGAAYKHGMRVGGIGLSAQISDIKFINYEATTSGIGLVLENESDASTSNIHSENCSWCGIYAFNTVRARISGGKHANCRSGIIVNDTQVSVVGSNGNPIVISGSTESGLYWSRGSQGHADYIKYEDNAVGLIIAENSRVDTIKNEFYRNVIGLVAQTGGQFGEGGALNIFGTGANANTTAFQHKANSLDVIEDRFSTAPIRIGVDRAQHVVTGKTQTDITKRYPIKALTLQGLEKNMSLKLYGSINKVTPPNARMWIVLGTQTIELAFPSAITTLTYFEATIRYMEGKGGGRYFATLEVSGESKVISSGGSNLNVNIDNEFYATVRLGDDADSVKVNRSELRREG